MPKNEESLSELLPEKRLPLFRRSTAWLFSQKHFHVKLLSGTAAGVLVIALLAGIFLFVSYRNHRQEALRTHTIEVIRLCSVIESDIASLETGYRGFLLTGKASYLAPFEHRRVEIKNRVDALARLILDSPLQRKRVMKVQEIVQRWLTTVALPEINARQAKATSAAVPPPPSPMLGNPILEQARDLLQSLQNEEQIVLNNRMREKEWAAQSTQILDLLPKLERSVIEMEKEKRGYLLTGDNSFAEAYKRAATRFFSYHGYLSILAANSSEQRPLLAEIRTKVELWVNVSALPEMEAKRSRQSAALTSAHDVEELMAEIRTKIANFEKNEMSGYASRSAAGNRQRIVKTSALGILCLLAVGLLVVSNSYSCVLVGRQLSKLNGVETRIKSIIEHILDGMITVDEQGVICSMNSAAEKMFGCINNEMVGHKFIKVVPKCYPQEPEALPAPCAWDDLARRTGSTTLALGRTRRHATFPIEISLSEMTVDGRKLFVAMIRDVTERKRFEQEIAADKESLAVTLRAIGDGVITTDVKGKIIMINKAGEELTGWESKEAIG
ncbi:MAG: CHASE3 domain-containing protein, partial [Burkholderiaceae bacterium]|nr:CHASE3 domain-containing protein [Burkholderiaceae bacterium]